LDSLQIYIGPTETSITIIYFSGVQICALYTVPQLHIQTGFILTSSTFTYQHKQKVMNTWKCFNMDPFMVVSRNENKKLLSLCT